MENRVKDKHLVYITPSVGEGDEMLVAPCVKDVVDWCNCRNLVIGKCTTVENFGISLPKHLNRYRTVEAKEFIKHRVNIFAYVGGGQEGLEFRTSGMIWERVK